MLSPGQATGTSEVATLMSTAEQSNALKTENAPWAEKKRTDMMKLPSMVRPAVDPATDANLIAGSVPVL